MRSVLAVVAAVLALPLPAVSAVAAPAMAAEEQAAIDRLAREIVGTETASMAKARRIIDWLNANFVWTDTDYGRRSLVEIIERRGGNCAEQARVARALMTAAGIRTRQIAEVNIQPESPQRQKDAEEVVAQYGASASVFGRAHNDHRCTNLGRGPRSALLDRGTSVRLGAPAHCNGRRPHCGLAGHT